MRCKLFLSFALVLFLSGSVSAFLISDQGTNVKNLTGSLLESGNLTIAVYDDITAGNLVFSSNTQGAIVNGSWNLMMNPSLQYGISYWKDYEINGEDVDFDGNERMEFQSPVGYINNISFINFSLINSCPSGSSIRLIYFNGSVECETDDSGNGTSADLTNYALKNQSENFAGNITTIHTGFFGVLGSLVNRITSLFVGDIDASGSINATGNVSASYFKGDGSLLSNLPAGSESDPIFVSENTTLWSAINSKLSQGDQRYNDTALIASVNTTANIISLGFYNRTEVDGLISGVSAGNFSFNQSLTDTLYYSINNPLSFINHTQATVYNETALILSTNSSLWSYLSTNSPNWLSTYNSSYNYLLGSQCPNGYLVNGTLQNGTFTCVQSALSESDPLWTANSTSVLYLGDLPLQNRTISHISNVTGFSFNYNQTTPAIAYIDSSGFLTSSAGNATYLLITDLPLTNRTSVHCSNITGTATNLCTITGGSVNVFNQWLNMSSNVTFESVNATREIYVSNMAVKQWLYNQSDGSYNSTYSAWSYNQTISANSYTDSVIIANNSSWISTYNTTYHAGIANNSWNETRANILYAGIQWAYNHTTSVITDINSRFWNITQSYNKTEIDSFNASWILTYNATYSNILNQQCPAGLVVNGTLANGTFTCITPPAGAESDPSWASNLTSGVSSDLNPLTNIIQGLGNSTKRWLKGWFKDLDVSNNVSVSGNVSAQFYFGSLNGSTFPTSSCFGTDKVVSILANGTVNCGADQTGSGSGTSFTAFNMTTSDVSTSDNVNYVEVITLPLNSGFNLMIECNLLQDSVATGTGIQYTSVLTGTSSQRQVMEYYSSATAQAICSGTTATLTCSPSSSSGTTVAPNKLYVYGVTSSAGTFTLNVKTEASGNAVNVRAGSWCRIIET